MNIKTWKNKLSLRELNIKRKLILMLYGAVLPFLIGISGYIYYTMQKGSTDSLSNAYMEIARQINESINFIQTDVSDISTYLCINETITRVLNRADNFNLTEQAWSNDSSMNFLMDIIATKSYISYIALYANNGYEPFYFTTDTSVLKSDINEIMKTETYARADSAKGAPVWEAVAKGDRSLFELNKSPKIMMTRVIINHMKVKNIGYLVFGINAKHLSDICRGSMTANNEGAIVRMEDQTLIETGSIEDGVKDYILSGRIKQEQLKDTKSGTVRYENTMIYYSKINSDSSEVYYIMPRKNMLVHLSNARLVSLGILTGVLFLMIPFAVIFSNSVARPLKALSLSMQKFKKGDFTQYVEYESKDEIGEVTRCYNDMVRNMKELIDTTYKLKLRERESELSTLQAQINPHFLYNTLDSIYWKSLEDGNQEISEMVYSLSRIFRLSLNRGQGMTTVEKEIELVKHYLMIQRMRFGERLEYTVSVEDSLHQYIIPKLILQPFVENAIIHGIEKDGGGGMVSVTAGKEGDRLLFVILDSGKGMSEEKILQLYEKAEGDININSTPGGYAISNVYERLYLKYKDDFELNIQSKENKGTKVEIKIPYTDYMERPECR